MKKILILGAMGFIGKSIINTLKSQYHVIAYDRIGTFPASFLNEITCYEGDFKTENRWNELLQDVDTVIHLISTTNVNSKIEDINDEIEANIIPTVRLLENMVSNHVNRLIFISSGGTVYGITDTFPIAENSLLKPICPYGIQKATIELYLTLYNHLYKMSNIILRVGNPYGLGQDINRTQGIIPIFIHNAMNNLPITIWGDGKNIRDYIYMEDLIYAIQKVITYQGSYHIFNVGGGRGYSVEDIINIICTELHINNLHVNYIPARAVDVPVNILDISRLKAETGWSPKVDLRSGIRLLYKRMCSET